MKFLTQYTVSIFQKHHYILWIFLWFYTLGQAPSGSDASSRLEISKPPVRRRTGCNIMFCICSFSKPPVRRRTKEHEYV